VAICLGTAAKPDSNNSADSGVFVIFSVTGSKSCLARIKGWSPDFPNPPVRQIFPVGFYFPGSMLHPAAVLRLIAENFIRFWHRN
jgi:hypothetical protein